MDRQVKRDITKRYKALGEYDNVGQITCYVCSQCGKVTKTVHKDGGVNPMGIECPHCHGEALCNEDGDTYPNIEVTHEWYKPSLDEVLKMADENKLFSVSMILSGGLLRREKQ